MSERLRFVPMFVLVLALSEIPLTGQSAFKWSQNTVVVDGNTAQSALKSVSTDGHILVFNTSDPRIVNLKEGQILFLEDMGARKVMGILRQPPLTAVSTNAAALTDFIQDGTIQFPNNSSSPTILNEEDTTNPGVKEKTGSVNDWNYSVHGDADNSDLDFSFDAEKNLGGLNASVKGAGGLKDTGFSFMADIHGAELQKLLFTAQLKGNLKVNWAAQTSGANSGIGEHRLQMPAFFKEIFVTSHLPFLYQINANLIFTPGLGGKKDAVSGGFEVVFDGKGGFAATQKDSSPVKQMEASSKSIDKVESSALAAHGIVLAVNAPRVSFSFGTASFLEAVKQLDPKAFKDSGTADGFEGRLGGSPSKPDFFKIEGGAYVQWVDEYDYAGSGPLSLVANCSTTHFNLIGSAGADAKLFGLPGKGTFELYTKNATTTEPDIQACRIAPQK
jgi:hypothetical protein